MSSVERRFFSAENLERAVLEAAGHFGVDPQKLRYERVDKRSGFTKRRRVVIRIDPQNLVLGEGEVLAARAADMGEEPELLPPLPAEVAAPVPTVSAASAVPPMREEPHRPAETAQAAALPSEEESYSPSSSSGSSATPEPSRGGRERAAWRDLPRSPRESLAAQARPSRDVEKAVGHWLGLLLELADLELAATIRLGGDRLDIGLEGADSEWLVEDEGEALQALQTLLPRLLDGDTEEAALCRIDCDGFQELREERLRTRAHRAAADVRRTGERAVLEPMMPSDRRIVHLALLNDSSVTTESLGRGFFKRVTIKPS